ncbi:hypothetical protein FCM35_KLT00100 [Carex littledalei]|uniref:Uncharacterized protein n=1 Tax=Carex littledalei TaxID=544730 RepID=A0A833RIM8_9POAL|nr:hypothetical protein FCM35_KLT00100 [Carex littledalei]
MDEDSDQSEESEEILNSEDIDMDRYMYTIEEEETEGASAESRSDPSQTAEPETAEPQSSQLEPQPQPDPETEPQPSPHPKRGPEPEPGVHPELHPKPGPAPQPSVQPGADPAESDNTEDIDNNDKNQPSDNTAEEETAGVQSLPPEIEDDGTRRFRKRRVLRMCPEAFELSGVDLDWSADKVQTGKRKRNKKGKKSDVKGVRGLAKPRELVHPDRRHVLKVVGDYEFTAAPECSKVVTTIRLVTCECLPGPIRLYNMFPSRVRLEILSKFLQRYSWAEGEDVGHCLNVFENIAADT